MSAVTALLSAALVMPVHAETAPRATAHSVTPTLTVVVGTKRFGVVGDRSVSSGRVEIDLQSVAGRYKRAAFGVVELAKGYSFHDFTADERYLVRHGSHTTSADKKRLGRLVSKATGVGGAVSRPGHFATTVMNLGKGTYTIYDAAKDVASSPTTLRVSAGSHHSTKPDTHGSIHAKADGHFGGSTQLPASGTIRVANDSHNDQTIYLQKVATGTTTAEITRYYSKPEKKPATFSDGTKAGTGLLSVGRALDLTYSAPRGEYVELSLFPKTSTGKIQAFTGMYRVVHLG